MARPRARRSRQLRSRLLVPTWPRLAMTGAVVAAATAVVVTVSLTWPTAGRPSDGSTVALGVSHNSRLVTYVLDRAATAALQQQVPRDNQFVYTEITGSEGVFPPHPAPGEFPTAGIVEQLWQSADGSRTGTVDLAPCQSLTPSGISSSATPGGGIPSHCVMAIPPGKNLPAAASYAGLRTLPTSPAALLAYIDAHYLAQGFNRLGLTRDQVRWSAIQEILRDTVTVPPALAAAIFTAVSTMHGSVLLQHVVDAAGKPGIAVAMPEGGGLSGMLIFDPVTYKFIGSEDVVTTKEADSGNQPVGSVFYSLAVVRTQITSTAPAPPVGQSDTFSYQPNVDQDFSR